MAEAQVEVEYQYFAWPVQILSWWMAFQAIFCVICLGIFAQFDATQNDLGREVPWYFNLSIAVAVITLVFIGITLLLFNIRLLTPFYMLAFGTIGFILWLVALIGSSLGLFANQNNAGNDYCHAAGVDWAQTETATVVVDSGYGTTPVTTTTQQVVVLLGEHKLALYFWSQLCSCWKAAFVFQLFACLGFLYIIYLAFDVLQRNRKAITVEEV